LNLIPLIVAIVLFFVVVAILVGVSRAVVDRVPRKPTKDIVDQKKLAAEGVAQLQTDRADEKALQGENV